MDPQVSDNPDAQRFEAVVDGEILGVAAYKISGDVITFTHTEVDAAAEGQGVGSALARAGLDEARARGLTVLPMCEFIEAWIGRHPEYADLTRPHE